MINIKQIHHAAYRCNDAKETVAFYKKYLNMELLVAIWARWSHLELSGVTWCHLEPSGVIWSRLGAILSHLGPYGLSGAIWSHLGSLGAIWSHLGSFGAI